MIRTDPGFDEVSHAQQRAEEAAKKREQKILGIGELFSTPEGQDVLELLTQKVDSRIESPKADNPTETIWYKEGQRSIVRWIRDVMKASRQIKEGHTHYPQVNFKQEGF
jgi:hypothetical protein